MDQSPPTMQRHPTFRALLMGLSLFAAFSGNLTAADAPPKRTLTLEECVQLALQKNLDIRVTRVAPEIARYGLQGSYGAYDPTLSLGLSHTDSTAKGRFDPDTSQLSLPSTTTTWDFGNNGAFLQGALPSGLTYRAGLGYQISEIGLPYDQQTLNGGISLTQPLLKNFWIDQTRLTIELNKQSVRSSDLDLRQQIMSTLNRVEKAFNDVGFSREFVKVQEEALALAEKVQSDNQRKVEVGAAAPLEVELARSQVASSRASLIEARNAFSVAVNTLKGLITDDFAELKRAELDVAVELRAIPTFPQVQYSWLRALTQRPDIEKLRIGLQNIEVNLIYAKNQLYPSLDIVGSYYSSGYNSTNNQFGPVWDDFSRGRYPRSSIGLNFSMPLGNTAARNRVRSQRASKEEALLRLKQSEQAIMVEIDNAIGNIQTKLSKVDANREAAEYAKKALDAEQKKLENGKSTTKDVLDLQVKLTQAASGYIGAIRDYNNALADLALSEGGTLERHHLDFATH